MNAWLRRYLAVGIELEWMDWKGPLWITSTSEQLSIMANNGSMGTEHRFISLREVRELSLAVGSEVTCLEDAIAWLTSPSPDEDN